MISDRHPKGTKARVLLTSVFGPYAQDDTYGSRAINPMELYHNQVTRVQGPFSLRMFHRSWGIMMIQANIDAPSTVLDFPVFDQFVAELRQNEYDIVGISSIVPNVGKVKKMCELIREIQPRCTIVVGGHVANLPGIEQRIDADHIVKGEGIAWFRRFLGQDDAQPVRHPAIVSGFGGRTMGMSLGNKPSQTAAVLIPSVGCPLGCNFCSTSAMFGGKGSSTVFYDSGRQLFDVMLNLEGELGTKSFFVMDENFLLYRKRALQLLDLMKQHGKSWSLYVFSSAQAIRAYSEEELVGLGISWVWIGLEGEKSAYSKLKGSDTQALVRMLQSNGIKVLGSSIIGLETHKPENIDSAIDYSVAHNTDFHQFMLYTPVPGTPLYEEHRKNGTLRTDVDEADTHGQFLFNFNHPHISRDQSGEFLVRAFTKDYEVNGPSIMRIGRTVLTGWQRHKEHPDARVRARYKRESKDLAVSYAASLRAMETYFRGSNRVVSEKARKLRLEIQQEFGLKSIVAAALGGALLKGRIRREEKLQQSGATYEPATFVEKLNWEKAPAPEAGLNVLPAPVPALMED
jgi:hypothetical protein